MTGGRKETEWRERARRPDGTRQARLAEFGFDIPPEPHDHRFDVFWERDGRPPPCRREPGDPYWEPAE